MGAMLESIGARLAGPAGTTGADVKLRDSARRRREERERREAERRAEIDARHAAQEERRRERLRARQSAQSDVWRLERERTLARSDHESLAAAHYLGEAVSQEVITAAEDRLARVERELRFAEAALRRLTV
jgi:hypothetical protein